MIVQSSRVVLRAALVVATVVVPLMLVPAAAPHAAEAVVLAALLAGLFTIAEYGARGPGLVEFRDAPPYNRIRLGILAATVLAVSIALGAPSVLTDLLAALGAALAATVDVMGSPLRVLVGTVPDGVPPETLHDIRVAAGLAWALAALGVGVFVLALRLTAWPGRTEGRINLWVNLPTFDPSAPGDVVGRLRRDGVVNLALGAALPYVAPPLAAAIGAAHGVSVVGNDLLLVWVVALWAFLPVSLVLRGIALRRLATAIAAQRAAEQAVSEPRRRGWLTPA